MRAGPDHGRAWLAMLLVPVVLAAAVYLPIRHVWFFSDDLMHLVEAETEPLLIFLLRPFGGHNYLVRNSIFLASYELFGLRASLYYWTVLATHLANVALLFGVVRGLSGSAWLACLAAAAWGTSPILVGTLAWYSVYGQVLVATVLLLVLLGVGGAARAQSPVSPRAAAAWFALLLAGTTCFGTGVGIALVFPIVLFLLREDAWRRRGMRAAFLLLPVVTLAVYFGLRRFYAHLAPLSFQEALQEALFGYNLRHAPAMMVQLLGFSVSASVLGYFAPVYPAPASVAAVAAFTVGLGVVARYGDPRVRRIALAMALLTVAIYGILSAGRAAIYDMLHVPPAAAAATARYHYVGSIPITILIALILQQVGRLGALRRIPRALSVALVFGLGAFGYARAGSPVTRLHAEARDWFVKTMDAVAFEARRAEAGRTVYLENGTVPKYVSGGALPLEAIPGRAAVFFLVQHGDVFEGRTVRFIERNPLVLAYYRDRPRNRLGSLLVGPEESGAPAQ